jgi:DNA (cytosine-5)-methyltransferase 1
MKVLDTFAGAGGFSLGFDLAGNHEIVGAIEFDQWAADTFKYNHPNSTVVVGDIQKYDSDYLLNTFIKT